MLTEDFVCVCSNAQDGNAFFPCNEAGTQAEPPERFYICGNCGRMIDGDTLEVVGRSFAF